MSINIPQTLEQARKMMAIGRFADAENLCRQIISIHSDHPQALHILGQLALAAGRPDLAVQYLQQSLEQDPRNAHAYFDLANALMKTAPVDQAIAVFRRAIQLQPNLTEAYVNLGIALALHEQLEESIAVFRTAIAQRPNFPEAHDGLGMSLRLIGQPKQAVSAHQKAIELRPPFASAHSNLGLALIELGEIQQAIAAFRKALRLAPNFRDAHTAILFNLHYSTPYDADLLFREHQAWNRSFAQPLARLQQSHTNDRNSDRPLRIGYVSADFRQHPIAFFIENLLAGHDPKNVQVFCYADMHKPDEVTRRLQTYTANWRDITNRTDDEVDRMIRQDEIDILVDLAGHTAGNRLLLFAAKPAPIQVTYLGYPDTTGLTTIDYRLTDAFADPPGLTESLHSEQLIRLPGTFLSYRPPSDSPQPSRLPAETSGRITFGCFNAWSKINAPLAVLWSQILHQVPGSKLLLKNSTPDAKQHLLSLFSSNGINADRLEFLNRAATTAEHLQSYNRIDIALDTYPYNGTTTTCEATWMGVPVVTLAGATHISRVGLSLLSNMELTDLIAQKPQDYVRIAVSLAADLASLNTLRKTLRGRMQASPVMDAASFVRGVESAYREMWRNKKPPPT